MGLTDNKVSAFQIRYDMLKVFVEREGHACIPVSHKEMGFNLGRWVAAQRSNYHAKKLRPDYIQALEELNGWVWRASDFEWDKGIAALKSFYKREKHVLVPSNHIENRFELGQWVCKQRKRLNHGRLSAKQVKAFTRFGSMDENWRKKRNNKRWDERFAVLTSYAKKYGSSSVPRYHVEDGVALGVWVNSLRSQYSKGTLGKELVDRLESLPDWKWAKKREGGEIEQR